MARRSRAILGGLTLLAAMIAGPTGAHAATIFGSGSSAMQPYFEQDGIALVERVTALTRETLAY